MYWTLTGLYDGLGINDQNRIILNEQDREGQYLLLTIEENHEVAFNPINRHKTRLKFEPKIDELTSSFRMYKRMIWCSIPINKNYYLLLTLDFDQYDLDKIIIEKIIPLIYWIELICYSAIGNVKLKVAPFSSELFSAHILPLCASIIFLHISTPKPVPVVELETLNFENNLGNLYEYLGKTYKEMGFNEKAHDYYKFAIELQDRIGQMDPGKNSRNSIQKRTWFRY